MTHHFDALILGGGAAGLMCAIESGKRGRRVAVLDHADRLGKKILISGGGRCNFTNLHCRPENFLSSNPHFAKSALARYTPADFIALVEKHRIPYHEKTLGQLFCDRSAREILGMLEEECRVAGVSIFLNTKIRDISRTTEFVARTANSEFHAPALVVATGGLSIPKIGATSFGYDLAGQFGLKIRGPWPGLVPLVLDAEDRSRYCDLTGVSAEVIVSCGEQAFREKMLITHRGLSGPAILQVSSYWKKPREIKIDLAPESELTSAFHDPKVPRTLAALRSEFRKTLPARFADRWLEHHAPTSWTNPALAALEQQAHAWTITPSATEGYEKAEVTCGGVDTDELSAKTMESREVPGLFFIGEVVDVTGHLGGFNFQWAWASGAAAAGRCKLAAQKSGANTMRQTIRFLRNVCCFVAAAFIATAALAQAPASTLLALSKDDHTVAIVDPATLQVLARIPSGPEPHEIIASSDGKFAYISNYGGLDSTLNTISVVDLVARKALPPIDLGALRSTHGLDYAGGKLYFTAETNKVIGRYDPATQRVDWILGTGQDRTHMVVVATTLDRIFTSNVNSATISIIEQAKTTGFAPPPGAPPGSGPSGPPPGNPRLTWEVTNVPAGQGCEGFDVSPDGKELWAANARDATVTIIDIAAKKAIQTLPIPVKGANRLKFTPDGKQVLISGLGAHAGDSSLVVIDASTRKEVKQLALGGGAAGILIAPDGARAYVAVSTANKIAVVDLKTLEVVGQIEAGKQPDGLAWATRQ